MNFNFTKFLKIRADFDKRNDFCILLSVSNLYSFVIQHKGIPCLETNLVAPSKIVVMSENEKVQHRKF